MATLEVAILCGGRGTRMRRATEESALQKCLLNVEGRPILARLLDTIADAFGTARVFLVTAYGGAEVRARFGKQYREIELQYVHAPTVKGTRLALLDLREVCGSDFLMMHGDILCHPKGLIDLRSVFEKNRPSAALLVATEHPDSATTHGVISFQGSRVTALEFPPGHTPGKSGGRYMGIDWFSRDIFRNLKRVAGIKTISGVLQRMIGEGQNLIAVSYANKWYHFVTPQDLNVSPHFD